VKEADEPELRSPKGKSKREIREVTNKAADHIDKKSRRNSAVRARLRKVISQCARSPTAEQLSAGFVKSRFGKSK
jgi:hypothetical protein